MTHSKQKEEKKIYKPFKLAKRNIPRQTYSAHLRMNGKIGWADG
jgi:hypothetical protein